jgi:predicted N-acetyltransferase YhbS
VAIRTLTKKDVEAADRLLMRAFATADSFRSVVEREFAIQPEFYWVAEVSGAMAGTIAAVRYGEIAYLGMMAVDPDYQGRGIGRALLETAIESVPCETLLLDATDAAEPLYRKYGFIDEGFSYDLRGFPAGASGETELVDDMKQLIALDARTFGANRNSAIERLLAEPGSLHFQSDKGFLIAQERVLGPWVANDPATAEALLALCPAREFRVMMPTENAAGSALLERCGFQVRRTVRHMRRGKPFSREGRAITYGQASFALG